uniref:SAM domain-containing protein n=1 Tax=Hucho hucho TaxID=62062 RepID=A0A4W5LS23_9TELE
ASTPSSPPWIGSYDTLPPSRQSIPGETTPPICLFFHILHSRSNGSHSQTVILGKHILRYYGNVLNNSYVRPIVFDLDLSLSNSSSTQPLLSPNPTDLSSVATVSEWLTALRMDRYKDQFERAHLDTLDRVSRLTMEDVQNLGVNLLGHQRKITNAAQQLRTHLTQGQVEV